jgi:hypothetical protein
MEETKIKKIALGNKFGKKFKIFKVFQRSITITSSSMVVVFFVLFPFPYLCICVRIFRIAQTLTHKF